MAANPPASPAAPGPRHADAPPNLARLAVVVIGRNEGERLERSLDSLGGVAVPIVYVDSGSTDGSAELARDRDLEVVELGPERPYTAARARNAGVRRLETVAPAVELVQFVDGDCILSTGWLQTGSQFLRDHEGFAAVAGRLRELHPELSVYNRLCQMEWDVPAGQADQCGGIVLMRKIAFDEVGGFREELTAGEEPELCARLRRAGWQIMRLSAEMAQHDAGITRFAQWWNRCRRGGHAAMQGWALTQVEGRSHSRATVFRALGWGVLLPVTVTVVGTISLAIGRPSVILWVVLSALIMVLAQVLRIGLRRRGREGALGPALGFALFNILSKAPEAIGVLEHLANSVRGRDTKLVEYKDLESKPGSPRSPGRRD